MADVDPTLGDLEQDGEVSTIQALEYDRLFGGNWRRMRLSQVRKWLASIPASLQNDEQEEREK